MTDYPIGEQRCPWCGHDANRAGSLHNDGVEERGPEPGDTIFCIICAQPAKVTRAGTMRRPTKAEQAEIDADPLCRTMAEAIKRLPKVQ